MFKFRTFSFLIILLLSKISFAQKVCLNLENINKEVEIPQNVCLRSPEKFDQKYTLIEFFTTTCLTCKENLPILKDLHDLWKNKVSIKLVSLNPKKEMIEKFIEEYKDLLPYPIYFDPRRSAKKQFNIRLVPTLILFQNGVGLVFRHRGKMDEEVIKKLESFFES